MALIFKEVTFSEVVAMPGFDALIEEYGKVGQVTGIPNPGFHEEHYRRLHEAGRLIAVAALDDGVIVGLVSLVTDESGHYNFPMIVADSVYLMKRYRKGAAGLRLLGAAKEIIRKGGAPGFLTTAPAGSTMDRLCERIGAKHINNVWWCAV